VPATPSRDDLQTTIQRFTRRDAATMAAVLAFREGLRQKLEYGLVDGEA
jgi:hypothetical protein